MDLLEKRKPDLEIEGFKLWIHGRQFPESDDYWDGNWLNVTAKCSDDSAVVYVRGSILSAPELQRWLTECKKMYASLSGEAHLACLEPNLDIKIKMRSTGQCHMSISITPDHMTQQHSFSFDLDQSHLLPLIQNLEAILESYPIKL